MHPLLAYKSQSFRFPVCSGLVKMDYRDKIWRNLDIYPFLRVLGPFFCIFDLFSIQKHKKTTFKGSKTLPKGGPKRHILGGKKPSFLGPSDPPKGGPDPPKKGSRDPPNGGTPPRGGQKTGFSEKTSLKRRFEGPDCTRGGLRPWVNTHFSAGRHFFCSFEWEKWSLFWGFPIAERKLAPPIPL